jgi:putative molybdopterin biosynthesis protein
MGDILYSVVDKLGSPGLLVHGVKVKPGKPTILAVCNNVPIIGLPGYPASALSIHRLFVLPYIRLRAGLPPLSSLAVTSAKIKQRIRSVSGRHEFKPMNLIQSSEGLLAFPVPGGSGAITSIALADGFIEIPEDTSFLLPDMQVNISLLSEDIQPYSVQIIGSHCIALSQLQKLFSTKFPQYKSRSIAVGSTGGVSAIRRGEAHLAGIHLLDPKKGYNSWVLDEFAAILIPGYYRMQGFIVQKGNPKQIYSVNDLTRSGVRFMNRNPGSGTRILTDMLLEKSKIDKKDIEGYNQYCKSHTSVAVSVQSGLVDVGVGIENAVTDKLEFIELREEEYDFLINKDYCNLQQVQDFISLIQSKEFKEILENLKGYRPK